VTPADSSTLVDPTTDTRSPASSSQSHPPVATPLIPIHTSATAIATVGSQTINAIPGLSVVVLPNGSTAKPGSVATVTDSNSHPVIVSVGTSGIFIGGTSHGESTSFFANPTFPPVVIATVASNVISAAPGATHIVVGSQTASLGGPAITVSGSVIQLTPSGVVVNDGSSGAPASTFPIPTLASAHDVAAPTAIATVGGHTISAPPGASTVVIGAQVVTAGGSPITLAGSNNVASLGPNSLVIQFPGGSVSSFALPTAAPSIGGIVGTVAGISISASAGASVITVGSQAVTLGGAPITIPGNNVVSAGSSRLEIQMPGGGVSTLSAQTEASAAASVLTSSATSSNRGIASIIASSMSSLNSVESGSNVVVIVAGASQTGTVNVSSNSSSGLSTPVSETNSSGRRIEARSKLFCLWAVFCVGGRLAFGV
jgi:hypothetical protein